MLKLNALSLKNEYMDGMSINSLANKYGVALSTIHGNLKSVETPMRAARGKKIDHQKAAEMYKSGMSTYAIAKIFVCTAAAILYAIKKHGICPRPPGGMKGILNSAYKGGIRTRKDGYNIVRGDSFKLFQHRVKAQKVLGRKLKHNEHVHHVNGNRSDNRNKNLIICTAKYHVQLHIRMKKHPYWNNLTK